MRTINDGGPAFPRTIRNWNDYLEALDGMSLRAYVAAQVLPTIIAECREDLRSRDETYPQFCASRAMEFADALIAELRKETR